MPEQDRTALYRLYDASDQLLYIGIAKDPDKRWAQHAQAKRSTWWPQVARKTVHWFPGRDAAEAAETTAINTEQPRYNHAKREGSFPLYYYKTGPEILLGAPGRGTACTQVTEILRRELREGVYTGGTRMPSGQDLQDRFRVSIPTIYKALRLLVEDGLLERKSSRSAFFVI